VNFTREPIIETIITPKEGCKLLIRNSKVSGNEESYLVDAVEVVTFGLSFFFRSLERPKSFLVPVHDYEVVEVKETRLALKNVSMERSIKIGGGKAAPKVEQRPAQEDTSEESQDKVDKKRERRRHRRRKGTDDKFPQETKEATPTDESKKGGDMQKDETKVSSPSISRLIPPPTTLITHSIARYKEEQSAEKTPQLPEQITEETQEVSSEKETEKKQNQTKAAKQKMLLSPPPIPESRSKVIEPPLPSEEEEEPPQEQE
jgi:hypothetical protein